MLVTGGERAVAAAAAVRGRGSAGRGARRGGALPALSGRVAARLRAPAPWPAHAGMACFGVMKLVEDH